MLLHETETEELEWEVRGRESVGERGGGAERKEIYFKDLSLSCGTQNPYIYIFF